MSPPIRCLTSFLLLVAFLMSTGCPPSADVRDDDPSGAEASSEPKTTETVAAGSTSTVQLADPETIFTFDSNVPLPAPNAGQNCREGQRAFEEALSRVHAMADVKLDEAPAEEAKSLLEKKTQLLGQAEGALQDVIKTNCQRWTTAAMLHIGLQYAHIAEETAEMPVPSSLTAEQRATYCRLLSDRIGPFYAKAQEIWQRVAEVSKEEDVHNRWTGQAVTLLEDGDLDLDAETDACIERGEMTSPPN